jgi:hypothetical protein
LLLLLLLLLLLIENLATNSNGAHHSARHSWFHHLFGFTVTCASFLKSVACNNPSNKTQKRLQNNCRTCPIAMSKPLAELAFSSALRF